MSEEIIRKMPFTYHTDMVYVAITDFQYGDDKFKAGDEVKGYPKNRLRRLYRKNLGRIDDPYTQLCIKGKVEKHTNGMLKSFAPAKLAAGIMDKVKNLIAGKVTAKSKKSDLVKYAEQNGIVVDPEATNKEIYEQIQKGVK